MKPMYEDTISVIQNASIYRNAAIGQQKRATNSLLATFRVLNGYSTFDEEKIRKKKSKEAQDKLKRMDKAFKLRMKLLKKGIDPADDLSWQAPLKDEAEIQEYFKIGEHVLKAKIEFDNMRKVTDKEIEGEVNKLPIHAFANTVKGFGVGAIGLIIGEAGNLSNYSNPAKLWKRMGLAVIDGKRQGTGLKGDAEKAAKHGYSPRRRSVMYTIGDALIKQNKLGKGADSEPLKYRQIYLVEKSRQLELNPDMKPIQIHRRAQRKMEKELLKDFWAEWHKVM